MIAENVKIGLASIRKNRFRSFLTMLGIIIGVVSVVTIVSLGEGVKRQINGQVKDLGADLITVRPGNFVVRDDQGNITGVNLFANTGVASLTDKDVADSAKLKTIEDAVGMRSISGVAEYQKDKFPEGVILATPQNLPSVIDHEIEFGTYFDESMINRRNVVIGPGVAEKLFKETIPLGKSMKIRGQSFTVQGIFKPFKEVPISSGVNYNNVIMIPEPIATQINGSKLPIYEILIKVNNQNAVNSTVDSLEKILLKNHQGQKDFTILKQNEASAASEELLDLLTNMIIGMAAITLFVGGIGIMNVMLVSVSERTREIGIRKAIGATNRQIRTQFMIEAIILSVWGVFWGVIMSGLLNIILRLVTDLQPVLLWEPIVIAGLISIGVGIFFGVVPAIKASLKDPIESLRPN